MDIQIKKEKLFPSIVQVQGILDKRNLLPIFSNLLLKTEKDALFIYASDSELSFFGSLKAKVKKEGSFVLNGKQFFDILRELSDGDIFLTGEKNNRVKIKQNTGVFCLNGLNPEDYPVFPEVKIKKFQKIKAKDLLNIIDKTIYCVSLDESRYHLTGVFCDFTKEGSRFVATDGHRMSFVDIPSENLLSLKEGVIIPRKGLGELRKMLSSEEDADVEWAIEKPRLIVKFNSQVLSIRLIEGNYPDYKQLIPKEKGQEITLERELFLSALKRVSVLTSARFKGVLFAFKKKTLSIESSHPEFGEAKEDVPCEGRCEINIRFNSKYILDIVNSISDKKIKFTLKNETSPGVLQGEKTKNYTCVVMPMKI